MEEQKDLPKPQTDLPRPEKEISAKTGTKSSIFKSKFFLLFIAISFLIAFLIGGFILGKNNTEKQIACTMEAKICPDGSSVGRTGPNCEFSKCSEVTPALSPSPVDETTQNFLEIPEYGVKFALSDSIKDAYYSPIRSSGNLSYVYLKIHSLDSETYCNKDGGSIAALTRVARDEIDERTGKKFSDSGSGSIIGNYYYFVELSQAVCSQNNSNQTIEMSARTAFSEASKTITSL